MNPRITARSMKIGGVLAIGLAIALALKNGLFPGFGSGGNGDGTQVSALNNGTPQPAEDREADKANERQPDENDTAQTNNPPQAGDVVDVLIDARQFLVRREGKADYEPIELSRLVELARSARGNEDGIRVRIFRKESSRASAEKLLQEKLTEAGLPTESLVLQQGFVP